jgi:hypothetical protein
LRTYTAKFVGRRAFPVARIADYLLFRWFGRLELMKILIQDARNGQYLTDKRTWTPAPAEARDFRCSSYAYTMMRRERARGLRVLFYFEETEHGIHALRETASRNYQRATAVLEF